MKRLAAFLFSLLALSVMATDYHVVYFDLAHPILNAHPASNRVVTIQPLTPYPGNLISWTATNGTFYSSNAYVPFGLFNGNYAGEITERGSAYPIRFYFTLDATNDALVNFQAVDSEPVRATFGPSWSAANARYLLRTNGIGEALTMWGINTFYAIALGGETRTNWPTGGGSSLAEILAVVQTNAVGKVSNHVQQPFDPSRTVISIVGDSHNRGYTNDGWAEVITNRAWWAGLKAYTNAAVGGTPTTGTGNGTTNILYSRILPWAYTNLSAGDTWICWIGAGVIDQISGILSTTELIYPAVYADLHRHATSNRWNLVISRPTLVTVLHTLETAATLPNVSVVRVHNNLLARSPLTNMIYCVPDIARAFPNNWSTNYWYVTNGAPDWTHIADDKKFLYADIVDETWRGLRPKFPPLFTAGTEGQGYSWYDDETGELLQRLWGAGRTNWDAVAGTWMQGRFSENGGFDGPIPSGIGGVATGRRDASSGAFYVMSRTDAVSRASAALLVGVANETPRINMHPEGDLVIDGNSRSTIGHYVVKTNGDLTFGDNLGGRYLNVEPTAGRFRLFNSNGTVELFAVERTGRAVTPELSTRSMIRPNVFYNHNSSLGGWGGASGEDIVLLDGTNTVSTLTTAVGFHGKQISFVNIDPFNDNFIAPVSASQKIHGRTNWVLHPWQSVTLQATNSTGSLAGWFVMDYPFSVQGLGDMIPLRDTNGLPGFIRLYGSTNGGFAVLTVAGSEGSRTMGYAEIASIAAALSYFTNNVGGGSGIPTLNGNGTNTLLRAVAGLSALLPVGTDSGTNLISLSPGTGIDFGGASISDAFSKQPSSGVLSNLTKQPDPNTTALLVWDDTDGYFTNVIAGAGLSYDHASHTLSAPTGGSGDVQSANNLSEFSTGSKPYTSRQNIGAISNNYALTFRASSLTASNFSVAPTNYTDRVEATNSSTLTLFGGGAELLLSSSTVSTPAAGGFSGIGSSLTALNASQLTSGTAPPARLATNAPFSNSWVRATSATTAEFSRDGSGFTNLSAPNLAGSIADARLSANVSLLGQTITEGELALTDVTTANASTTAHGFAPKYPNDATKYLDGTGSYSVPAGSGGFNFAANHDFTGSNAFSGGFSIWDGIRNSNGVMRIVLAQDGTEILGFPTDDWDFKAMVDRVVMRSPDDTAAITVSNGGTVNITGTIPGYPTLSGNNTFAGDNTNSGSFRISGSYRVAGSSNVNVIDWTKPAGFLITNSACTATANGTPVAGSRFEMTITNSVLTNWVWTLPWNAFSEAQNLTVSSITIYGQSESVFRFTYDGSIYRVSNPDGPNNTNLVTLSTSATVNSLATNNALQVVTNIPIVTSATIPMGAWFTNNVAAAPITAASARNPTNAGDAFCFVDAVTNAARTRFALPWDWNGGTVQIELTSMSTLTNGLLATNAVFNVRAAAIPTAGPEDNPTWGTGIWLTNKIDSRNTNFVSYKTISTALTVGNTPTSAKSILWEIQRLGAATGDTTTNDVCITEFRVFYQRNTRSDFPTATP